MIPAIRVGVRVNIRVGVRVGVRVSVGVILGVMPHTWAASLTHATHPVHRAAASNSWDDNLFFFFNILRWSTRHALQWEYSKVKVHSLGSCAGEPYSTIVSLLILAPA